MSKFYWSLPRNMPVKLFTCMNFAYVSEVIVCRLDNIDDRFLAPMYELESLPIDIEELAKELYE